MNAVLPLNLFKKNEIVYNEPIKNNIITNGYFMRINYHDNDTNIKINNL